MLNSIKKGIILAAGDGTRSRPLTFYMPKAMMPLGNDPMIKLISYQMINAGIRDIMVISKNDEKAKQLSEQIPDYLKKENLIRSMPEYRKEIENGKINISLGTFNQEAEKPVGTLETLKVAYNNGFLRDEPCVTMFSDSIIQSKDRNKGSFLENILLRYKGDTLVSLEFNKSQDMVRKSAAYVSQPLDDLYRLNKVVEKPSLEYLNKDPTNLSVAGGIYLLSESVQDNINKVKIGANSEYHITDLVDMEAREKAVYGYPIDTNRFKSYDVGNFRVFIKNNLEEGYREPFFTYTKNSNDAVKTILVGGIVLNGSKNDLEDMLKIIS